MAFKTSVSSMLGMFFGMLSSLFGRLLRGRYSLLFFLIPVPLVIAYVCLVSSAAWQTRLSGQQPAIRLSLHRDTSKLVLESEDDGEPIQFAVADSLAGVEAFWLELRDKTPGAQSTPLWRACPWVRNAAGEAAAKAGKELPLKHDSQEVGRLSCELDSEKEPSKEQPQEPWYLPRTKSRKVVLWMSAGSNPSTYRELWLIPYVKSQVTPSWTVPNPVSALHWTRVEWRLGKEGKEQVEAMAEQCSGRDGSAHPQCLFAETLLDRPDLVLLRDPQQIAIMAAHWMELRAVPITVGVMVFTNIILVALLVAIAGWWLWGSILSDKLPTLSAGAVELFDEGVPIHDESLKRRSGRMPFLLPLGSMERGLRHLLEWLEVTGPALGFLLTVCALLLAFEPRTFVERDMNRFATTISMAMNATFAGLGIRLLAFSIDRLLVHVLRRGGRNFKVDLMDNVYESAAGQQPASVAPAPISHLPTKPASSPPPPEAQVSAEASAPGVRS